MKFRLLLFFPFLAILLICANVYGQDIQSRQEAESDTEEETEAIPVPDSIDRAAIDPIAITEAFNVSNALIGDAGKKHFSETQIASFVTEVDTLFWKIDRFLKDSMLQNLYFMDANELAVIIQRSDFHLVELQKLQEILLEQSGELKETISSLSQNMQKWELTLNGTLEEGMPPERKKRIERISGDLDSLRSS